MLALLVTALSAGGLGIVGSRAGFDSSWFVVVVTLLGFGGAALVGESAQRLVPEDWWARLSISRRRARTLGITAFDRLLTAIGWNRLLLSSRPAGPDGTCIPSSDVPMRSSAAAHAWRLCLHLVASGLALGAGGVGSAAVICALGIVLHLYPALLQLRNLTRLRRLRMLRAGRPE